MKLNFYEFSNTISPNKAGFLKKKTEKQKNKEDKMMIVKKSQTKGETPLVFSLRLSRPGLVRGACAFDHAPDGIGKKRGQGFRFPQLKCIKAVWTVFAQALSPM